MINKLLCLIMLSLPLVASEGEFLGHERPRRGHEPQKANKMRDKLNQRNNVYEEFHAALENQNHDEAMRLANDVMVTGKGQREITPLMLAVAHGTPALVIRLLERGAPINEISHTTKFTALHWLIVSPRPDKIAVLNVLLEQPDIDISIKARGQTALELAVAYGLADVANLLRLHEQTHPQIPGFHSPKPTASDANWSNRYDNEPDTEPRKSSWKSIFTNFAGGLVLAALVYYLVGNLNQEQADS